MRSINERLVLEELGGPSSSESSSTQQSIPSLTFMHPPTTELHLKVSYITPEKPGHNNVVFCIRSHRSSLQVFCSPAAAGSGLTRGVLLHRRHKHDTAHPFQRIPLRDLRLVALFSSHVNPAVASNFASSIPMMAPFLCTESPHEVVALMSAALSLNNNWPSSGEKPSSTRVCMAVQFEAGDQLVVGVHWICEEPYALDICLRCVASA